jgi:hypothetical protein
MVGDVLTAAPGNWTSSPTSYAYQWQRCTPAGSGCTPISGATGATYQLVGADVGTTLVVTVTATNYAGTSAPADSAATAVVVTPAQLGSDLGATLRVELSAFLKPGGRYGSRREILKRRGYTYSLTAAAAGQLTVLWTARVGRHSVTIARGTLAGAGGVRYRFKVGLTHVGRQQVAKHARLRIVARATYALTAPGQGTVSAQAAFKL